MWQACSKRLGCITERTRKIPALVGFPFWPREAEYQPCQGTGSTAVLEPGVVGGMQAAGSGAVAQGRLLTEMQSPKQWTLEKGVS